MNRLPFYLLFVLPTLAFTQPNTLSGNIADSLTLEVLAFVHVIPNNDPLQGTSSDIDGNFQLQLDEPIQTLTLSYLGYQSLTYQVRKKDANVQIYLSQAATELVEAVVIAGENPAHRIIRKVVANRKKNDPLRIPYFSHKAYSKVVMDILPNIEFLKENRPDSVLMIFQQMQAHTHLGILESHTKKKFRAPDLEEETVLASRMSGLKEAMMTPLATDLQPFTFYREIIPILDQKYVNPISKGSTKKYYFEIQDTLYQQPDTVYMITFEPRKGKNFDGMKGVLYINTNGYALQNLKATPANNSKLTFEIEQQYQFEQNKHWFPKRLNYIITAKQYPTKEAGIQVKGQSYISEIDFETVLTRRDFGLDHVLVEKGALKQRDSTYWKSVRPVQLTLKEQRSYQLIDSIGDAKKLDRITTLMKVIGTGRLNLGGVDFLFGRLFQFNDYEQFRMNLSLTTSRELSKKFTLGGYYGYGFGDQQFKYSGFLNIHPFRDEESGITFRYKKDLLEVGTSTLQSRNATNSFLAFEVDRVEGWETLLNARLFRYLQIEGSLSKYKHQPTYDYQFVSDATNQQVFNFTEVGIRLHYSYDEKFIRPFGQRISMGSRFPSIDVAYTRGLNFLKGDFDYHKLEWQVSTEFTLKQLGTTSLMSRGGHIWGNLPYTKLFTGLGTGGLPVDFEHSFNNLDRYAFVADSYHQHSIIHSFESLLLKVKKFQPRIAVSFNYVNGQLQHPLEQHQGISFEDTKDYYMEGGLLLYDLMKLNYFNMANIGFGVGVYYGYDGTIPADWKDNVQLRVLTRFSF